MSRSAPPGRSSPISQSSLSTLEAKMSDIASLSAPDGHLYSRSAVRSGDRVRELVRGHVEARGVAVAELHLVPVPVRVVGRRAGVLAEVDRGDQLGAGVVVGVAAERVGVVLERLAEVVVDLVGLGVAAARVVALAADQPSGEIVLALGVVDVAVRVAGRVIAIRALRDARLAARGGAGDLADRALGLDRDVRVELRAEQRRDYRRHHQQHAHVLGGDLAGGGAEAEHAHDPGGAARAPQEAADSTYARCWVPLGRGTGTRSATNVSRVVGSGRRTISLTVGRVICSV
jgi:hypothetical protein